MTDLHQLSGPYALDALDDLERQRFEQHLAACESCRVEVASFLATLTEVAVASEETPPPGMRDAVLARVDTTRQVSPVVGAATRRFDATAVLRLAAGVLTVAVVGLTVLSSQLSARVGELEQLAAPAAEVLRSEESVAFSETSTADGAVVRVLATPANGNAVLVADGLATIDADLAYQLWLIDEDGQPTSAGLLDLDGTGDADSVLTGDMDTVIAIGISVEPAGGSPAPTTDPIAIVEI